MYSGITVALICKHNKHFLKHNNTFLEHNKHFSKHNTVLTKHNKGLSIETQHNNIQTQHDICKTQHKILPITKCRICYKTKHEPIFQIFTQPLTRYAPWLKTQPIIAEESTEHFPALNIEHMLNRQTWQKI